MTFHARRLPDGRFLLLGTTNSEMLPKGINDGTIYTLPIGIQTGVTRTEESVGKTTHDLLDELLN